MHRYIANDWRKLGPAAVELRLAHTLPTGQAFGWQWEDGEWVGALGESAVALREAPGCQSAEWRYVGGRRQGLEKALLEYFQLESKLAPLYADWALVDGRMAKVAACLEGARVLRQDPVECLVSFICSSNNNIGRISLMLRRLRERYGRELCTGVYTFPTLEAMKTISEAELRELGYGYRAPYVVASVQLALDRGGAAYLHSLRGMPRDEVQAALLDFKGVGRKVADCVALFSLDVADAVPVDTHVWRLARRDLDPTLQEVKSLTPAIYERIGNFCRCKFGDKAGWALSVLFTAELPSLAHKLPPGLLADMRDFKQHEKQLTHRAGQQHVEVTPLTPKNRPAGNKHPKKVAGASPSDKDLLSAAKKKRKIRRRVYNGDDPPASSTGSGSSS